MWPFKKKTATEELGDALEAVDEVASMVAALKKTTKPMVEVGRVEVVLILESGERETFTIYGKSHGEELVSPALERLHSTIRSANDTGFFGFGRDGEYARWIPTRRVKEILTTMWPHEVPAK
jgi:hypothetical protein